MKLILKEAFDEEFKAEEDKSIDTISMDDPEFDVDTLLKDDTIPDQVAFIDSEELNELRDIIYNLTTDIHLLLLNNDCIVIVKETEDNVSMVYCLTEDSSDFEFIELPNKLVDIMGNNNIIKYLPDQTYENHEKVVSLFKKDLPEEYKEEEPADDLDYGVEEPEDDFGVEEDIEVENTEDFEETPEEDEEDVKNKTKASGNIDRY